MLQSHSYDGDSRVRDAICGHVDWLRQFETCIELGELHKSAHDISCDDQCDFGKWLKTLSLGANDPAMEKLEIIVGLHRRFHAQAGEIASKVEAGQYREAHEDFHSKSFRRMTHSLIINLHDWRQDFKGTPKPAARRSETAIGAAAEWLAADAPVANLASPLMPPAAVAAAQW